MGFLTVEVHSYKKEIRRPLHSTIMLLVDNNLTANRKLEKVDVYNFGGAVNDHQSTEKRLIIFAHSTHREYSTEKLTLPAPEKIFGIENTVSEFLLAEGKGAQLVSDNGIVLAEYIKENNVLNITFDIFGQETNVVLELFKKILVFTNTELDKVNLLNSWSKTSDKQSLINSITTRVSDRARSRANEAKQYVDSYMADVETQKRKLAQLLAKLRQSMKDSEVATAGMDEVINKYLGDMELIANHEKIADVRYVDGKIEVFTNFLYIYDEDGNRYAGANYRFLIDVERTDVRFYSDNMRKSYWTRQDPHPHVNGGDGHACLGNVSSTIAELCSYNEIYALVLTCIDFVESVNTDDAAGKYVVNWDRVDEDGNIIEREVDAEGLDSVDNLDDQDEEEYEEEGEIN